MQRMGIPVLSRLFFQVFLVKLNVQPHFLTFLHVPSVLCMVLNISTSYPILIQSLLDMFFRYQVFHRTTLQISVIILAIHYGVFYVKCWYLFFVTLCKSVLSYVASKITHNFLMEVSTCFV